MQIYKLENLFSPKQIDQKNIGSLICPKCETIHLSKKVDACQFCGSCQLY